MLCGIQPLMAYTLAKMPEIDAFIAKAIAYRHPGPCLLWPYNVRPDGYPVRRRPGTKHTKDRVHVLVCRAVHGRRPSRRHQVAHSCRTPGCINPHHLRWATAAEDKLDQRDHGTINQGERNGAAKLTEADVRAIRAPLRGSRAMAREYGVTWGAILKIRTRQRWGWLE